MGAEADVAGGAEAAAAAAEQERKTLADLVARGAEWLAERVLMLNRAGAMIEARMTEYAQERSAADGIGGGAADGARLIGGGSEPSRGQGRRELASVRTLPRGGERECVASETKRGGEGASVRAF